jgi:hypothetical protein
MIQLLFNWFRLFSGFSLFLDNSFELLRESAVHTCGHCGQNIFSWTDTQFFTFWVYIGDCLVTILDWLLFKVLRNFPFHHTFCIIGLSLRIKRLHSSSLIVFQIILNRLIIEMLCNAISHSLVIHLHLLQHTSLQLLLPRLPLVLFLHIIPHLFHPFNFEAQVNLILVQLLLKLPVDMI